MQRLGAIDHHQDGAIEIKPALDQVSQQRLAGRGVLGGLLPATSMLLAVALDADRRQHSGDQRKYFQLKRALRPSQAPEF